VGRDQVWATVVGLIRIPKVVGDGAGQPNIVRRAAQGRHDRLYRIGTRSPQTPEDLAEVVARVSRARGELAE
jgi:hypothetical protein